MSYTPKTEEQLIREGLLTDGIYDCGVSDADDAPSKKGNPMFTLKLHVFDEDGSPRILYDYIALGNNFGERKLRHAADAFGLLDIYNTGALIASDFKNKTGKVSLKTQEGDEKYPNPKNIVHDYVKREDHEPEKSVPASEILADDGIPF